MMWQRETSYHNRRNYDDDAPRGASVSQARLAVAWLIDAARRRLGKLSPARREPSKTILLKPGDRHGFTVLGSTIARPFPEENEQALEQWADEGGAIAPPSIPHSRP